MSGAAARTWAAFIHQLQKLVDQRPSSAPAVVGPGSRNYDAVMDYVAKIQFAEHSWPAVTFKRLVLEDKVCGLCAAHVRF